MSEVSLLSMRAFSTSMSKVSPEQRINDLETLVNKINEIVKKVNKQSEITDSGYMPRSEMAGSTLQPSGLLK